MTDTSDLVERLKTPLWNEEAKGLWDTDGIDEERAEAATALTAKDKEIEALRADFAKLSEMAKESERLRSGALDVAEQMQARAETAERRVAELETENEVLQDQAVNAVIISNWFDLGRELDVPEGGSVFETVMALKRDRDEARAALKPFSDAASGYDNRFGDDEPTWGDYGLKLGHLRAARAVIEQGE